MKRTPLTTKTSKSTAQAKPAVKSAAKPAAAAKKSPAKKPAAGKSLPRSVAVSAAPTTHPASKQSQLIALLRSTPGATLAQMMALTGWQAHTVRGMLSGSLRKRLGLNVQAEVSEGLRIYRIVEEGAQ
ncbi:DUF3489 domain-containing protein [Hydrogenophaga atypica]|jgi:hypothetical protein|uniref:DUF3489 domain-containing protein n=1 Tax=Hydrogenophaga atypica TaxID=249409 RepID=A0ABW2QRF5_9BURK